MTKGSYTKEALSQKGHDSKEYTRVRTLEIVSQSCLLWDTEKKHLLCSWMDLAGPECPSLQMLLEHGALSPTSLFYGVDVEPSVLEGCQQLYAHVPQARWLEGDVSRLVERYEDVGVLVFDSHNGVAGTDLEDSLEVLSLFAEKQRERLGEFLLVVNTSTARRSRAEIEGYPALLSKHFKMQVRQQHLHKYVSSKAPMLWVALRWGF